jgi:hypothetical protein
MLAFNSESFFEHYFTVKAVKEHPDMLLFFSRMWSILLLSGGYASFTYCNGFGISFYNLLGQILYLGHFIGLLFGGLYDEVWSDNQKQMWEIQIGVNLVFLILAYLGHADATARGQATSETQHTEAATSAKVVGSFTLHQTNVNKFLGFCFVIYALCLILIPQQFFAFYFSAHAIDFGLFTFFSRGMGFMFFTAGVSLWLHNGGDGLSAFNMPCFFLFVVHFVAMLFGNIYNAAIWEGQKNMWYAQLALNLLFFTLAYLGNKDATERRGATAAATTAAATTAAL